MNPFDETLDEIIDETPQSAPAGTPAQADPFTAALDSVISSNVTARSTRMKAAGKAAEGIEPDRAADVFTLARRYGLPSQMVERNFDDIQRRAKYDDTPYAKMLRETPSLAEYVSDPIQAAAVKDDLEPLAVLEGAVRVTANSLRAVAAGVNRFNVGFWGVAQQAAEASGNEPLAAWFKWAREENIANANVARGAQEGAGELEKAFYSGFESVGLMVPGALASLATASPAPMLATIGTTTEGEAYGRARDAGKSVGRASLFGATQAAIEVATEFIPAKFFLKDLATNAGFRAIVMHQIASEIPGEQIATALQDLDEWATFNPEAPFSQYLKERPDAAIQTLVATITSVGATTAIAGSVSKLAGDGGRVERADQSKEFFDTIAKTVGSMKSAAKHPQSIETVIANATVDSPLEKLYAPLDTFTSYWQSIGEDPAAHAAELTGDPQAYAKALQTGEDLAIPTAMYASKVATSEHNAFFVNELRLGPDEMNIRESTIFKEQQAAKAQATADQATAAEGPDGAIRVALEQRLEAAGIERSTAREYVNLAESTFGSLSEAFGVDPLETFQRYGLEVERPALAEPAQTARPAASQARQKTIPVEPGVTRTAPDMGLAVAVPGGPNAAPAAVLETNPVDEAGRELGGYSSVERRATDVGAPAGQADRRKVAATADSPINVMQNIGAAAAAMLAENPNIGAEAQAMRDKADAAGDTGVLDKKGPESQTIEVLDDDTDVNASGESAASAEALSRQAGMQGRGEQFVVYDRAGRMRPLIGPEAVDYTARAGETYGVQGPEGFRALDDRGGKVPNADAEFEANRIVDSRRSPAENRVTASDPGSGKTAGKRAGKHLDRVFGVVLDSARKLDAAVDEARLREEFDFRVDLYLDQIQLAAEAGGDPRLILKTIAKLGGLYEKDDGASMFAELRDLGAGGKFGALAGVPGVFAKKSIARTGNQKTRGHGLDVMLQMLQSDPRFAWIESIDMLIDLMDEASRHGVDVIDTGILPGTEELRDVGIRREKTWWADAWAPADMLEGDIDESTIKTAEADTSFDVTEFNQSLFDEFDAVQPPLGTDTIAKTEPEPVKVTKGEHVTIDGTDVEVLRITKAYIDVATAEDLAIGAFTSYAHHKFRALFREGRLQLQNADTLDTGEVQPRLPEAGAVRDREVATPEIAEAPFALTAPTAKPGKKNAGQTTLFQGESGVLTREAVSAWADDIKAIVGPDLKSFAVNLTSQGDLSLDSIIVARGAQRAGIGSNVIRQLTRFADQNGARIILSPGQRDPVHGTTSRARLVTFYKRFGFVENKGRNKDFAISAGMLREPTVPTPIETVAPTATPAFKAWFGASKIVDEDGAPLRVFHGTTGNFESFDTERANIESDFGGGIYFSNSPNDVGENYAGMGPDLTNKVERRAEQIQDQYADNDQQPDDTPGPTVTRVTELLADKGLTLETATEKDRDTAFKAIAAEQLGVEHGGATLPVYLKIENPVVVGGDNETRFDFREPYDEDTDSYGEAEGSLLKIVEALREIGAEGTFFDFDAEKAIEAVFSEHFDDDEIGAHDLIGNLKGSEAVMYATDEGGVLVGNEIIRLAFERAGFDGIIDQSVDQKFGSQKRIGKPMAGMTPDTVHYIAFAPEQVKSAVGNRGTFDPSKSSILFQEEKELGGKDRRGAIRFGADRQFTIALLEKADLSTFLHESGHLFLEVFGDLADQFRGKDGLTERQQLAIADYDALLKWLGVENRAGIGEAQHEQFARGFEAYLMEGKAPSIALRSSFARFRSWLVGIYRSLKGLKVSLNDDVRRVLDRMVATDDAIAAAEAEAAVMPMFTTAESAGMTPEEFRLYRSAVSQASNTARETLEVKMLAELQREQEAAWKAQRQELNDQVRVETYDMPVYQAIAAMQRGTQPNGGPLIEGQVTPPMKLSRKLIVDRFGKDRLKRLPRPTVYSKDGGLDPDAAAQMFGYTSGDELLTAIENVEPMERRIRRETDRRMLEQHGSLLLDGTLQEKAQAAVANEHREEIVRAELRALGKLRRTVSPFVRQARQEVAAVKDQEIDQLTGQVSQLRAQARGGAARINAALPSAETIREAARLTVARMKVREIRPHVYWSAARRAGQNALEAAARQDFEKAIQEKQHELMSLAVFRESSRVVEDVEARAQKAKDLARPKAQQRLGKAGESYLEQVNAILDRYEFARQPGTELDRRASLRSWVAALQGQGLPVEIPDDVIDDTRRINYRELTTEELIGVTDALDHIVHLSVLKNKLLKAAEGRDLETAAVAIGSSIREHYTGKARDVIETHLPSEERRRSVAGFFASHRKLASLVRQIDGFQDGGALWEAIVKPLNDAGDREAAMNADATTKLGEIVKASYPGREKVRLYEKQHIPAIGKSFTKMGRLVIALNYGNEDGRQRLRDGYKWSDTQIGAILDTLDERDWRFVQSTWDYINSYWSEIAAKQERVTGVAPAKVEAVTVHTKFGDFNGGYFPLRYNERLEPRAGAALDVEAANLAKQAAYVSSTTRRGHTKERVKNVKLKVRTDFGVLFEHVTQVIHDLSHHEALIDVGRILGRGEVRDAIFETHGELVYNEIKDTVRDVAFGVTPSVKFHEKAFNHLRQGATIAGLGWNITTAMLQPIGLTQSMVRIGPKWVGRGLSRWLRDAATMENTVAWISERSTFMKLRGQTQQREINEIRNQIGVNTGKVGGWVDDVLRVTTLDQVSRQGVADSFFFLIQQMQRVADVPTWIGQYEKSMDAGETEERAVALADQAVLDAQGGGQVKDLAGVQRGTALLKLWTNFYSFFNTTYNLTVESTARTNFKKPGQIGRLAVDYLLLYSVPATLGYLVRAALKPGDEDEDKIAGNIIRENLSYLIGTIVGLRELSSTAQGYYGYEGPAGARAFATAGKLVKQIQQGEPDAAFWRALNDLAGVLFHYPSGQTRRTIEGIAAIAEGETQNPGAMVVGAPKK